MAHFLLDSNQHFIIEGYPELRAFASFLPGIAGPMGIPLWAFYVNRGQAIAGFGVESKDSPIMEFQPANKAYQTTPLTGFRTFLKFRRDAEWQHYEPFSPWKGAGAAHQTMMIGANELELLETDCHRGIQTKVRYFILPNESFAGLVRQVTIHNQGKTPLLLEILDGLPVVIPYGVNNNLLKEISRTLEAWMEVFNLPGRVPFYRWRASAIDRAEIETFQAGHFALAFADPDEGGLLPALVDPALVFEHDTAFYQPQGFIRQPLHNLLQTQQITLGRTPCGMFGHQATLAPGASVTIHAIYGHIGGLEQLERILPRITQAGYLAQKSRQAVELAESLTETVATRTASPQFDAYCRQNFLDNVLRGGWPIKLGGHTYHLYSRKHGDLERDYNAFLLAPEPYSQGETSYRDVNQNRRDDVALNPATGDFNIRAFMSLIQADGYNPRTVKGSTFALTAEGQTAVLAQVLQPEKLAAVVAKAFTPGKLLRYIADHNLELRLPPQEFLALALQNASQHLDADFHEGYWIDHWEYNLDLIESYLAVYPDRQTELLLGRADIPFFESPVSVQPRARKYVLAGGQPKQLGSLVDDKEKAAQIAARPDQPHWARTRSGEIYRTTLLAKLALTALLKFATLDPWGMGIEMEAGRPGWDDALNGLPGMFGSGMAETFELLRWLNFLRGMLPSLGSEKIRLPEEAADLLREVTRRLEEYRQSTDPQKDFRYWDTVAAARETYRQHTRLGFDGAEQTLSLAALDAALAALQQKVSEGVARALELTGGLPPTYFTFQVDEYDLLPETDPQGRPTIRAKRFTPQVLPPFLEGLVKAYPTLPNVEAARHLYGQVKASALFDPKLQMYRLNASLADQPHSIGRARAFPPGWLENESIWLHMEYKYLLAMLKAGLYPEFFGDLQKVLVPFLDPQLYGRSPLENSSFLVSSAHPDETLHGVGFVARLSGSTAEFISMWRIMMAGEQPFEIQNGQLFLALRPILPGWLFTAEGEVSFRFLGCCTVTYHNPQRLDTFNNGFRPARTELHTDSMTIKIASGVIPAPYAEQVRRGEIKLIDVWFE